MKTSQTNKLFRRVLTAALLVGGSFNLVAPVMAAGTAAGVSISNTATGTYQDSTTGATINATSNTVNITVAEVAGIDVTGVNQPTNVNPGNTINYDFKITNTGNAATKFVLPTTAQLSGTAATGSNVQSITYYTDAALATPYTITGGKTASIAADGAVYVRVAVQVASSAQANQTLVVQYGDTANPAGTNQARTESANDVYTEDADGGAAPINGVREDSAITTATVGAVGSVLNGPRNQPGATGNDNNTNTDFTNASSEITGNIAPGTTTYNPAPLTFTNTIQNTSNTIAEDVYLEPTTLTEGMQLRNGTTVTITNPATGGTTATYTWNDTSKTFSTTATTPVKINIAAGSVAQYQVTVDLPAGTPLSTDLRTPGNLNTAVGGYSVPITAYADVNGNGIDPTDATNTTINRTYVGYLVMYKEARILAADGTTQLVGWTQDSSALSAQAAPGNIIEYRIQYKNISEDSTTNSIDATANNVVITEDGSANGNTWGASTTNQPNSDISTAGTVGYFNGEATSTRDQATVTKYVNTLASVAPQVAGEFRIQRKVK